MPAAPKITGPVSGEQRFKIPPILMESFANEARVVLDLNTRGLLVIDPGLLTKSDVLRKLAADKDFTANFEVLIVPKAAAQR